ncbi:hypothetical protein ACSVDA_14200 [Cytobacillus sp. Hm23]
MKTLKIWDETIVVTYNKLRDGALKISNGWVGKNDKRTIEVHHITG